MSLTPQLKNRPVILKGNEQLPVRLMAPACWCNYSEAAGTFWFLFALATDWGEAEPKDGLMLGWQHVFFGSVAG
jgi:hypothetical protein